MKPARVLQLLGRRGLTPHKDKRIVLLHLFQSDLQQQLQWLRARQAEIRQPALGDLPDQRGHVVAVRGHIHHVVHLHKVEHVVEGGLEVLEGGAALEQVPQTVGDVGVVATRGTRHNRLQLLLGQSPVPLPVLVQVRGEDDRAEDGRNLLLDLAQSHPSAALVDGLGPRAGPGKVQDVLLDVVQGEDVAPEGGCLLGWLVVGEELAEGDLGALEVGEGGQLPVEGHLDTDVGVVLEVVRGLNLRIKGF